MGGTTARKGSSNSPRKATPKKAKEIASLTSEATTPTPRKKQRASDFASKPASAKQRSDTKSRAGVTPKKKTPKKRKKSEKKRQTKDEEENGHMGKDDDEEENNARIEDMMDHLRNLMEKDKGNGSDESFDPQLREAFEKADEAFQMDLSDGESFSGSDSDAAFEGIPSLLENAKKLEEGKPRKQASKEAPKDARKQKEAASKETKGKREKRAIVESDESSLDEGTEVACEGIPSPLGKAKKLEEGKPRKQTSKEMPKNARKQKKAVNKEATKGKREKRKLVESGESGLDENAEAEHQAEIEALKKDDPDFYKFLEENEASLLDFDISGMEEDSESQSGSESDGSGSQSASESKTEKEVRVRENLKATERKEVSKVLKDTRVVSAESEDDLPEARKQSADINESDSESAEGDERAIRFIRPGTSNGMPADDESDSESDSEGAEKGDRIMSDSGLDEPAHSVAKPDDVLSSADDESVADSDMKGTEDVPRTKNGKLSAETAVQQAEAGYSDDDDDDSEAEAEAAAEAGLASDSENNVDNSEDEEVGPSKLSSKNPSKGSTVVDMKYLQDLKQLLQSNRSCLKAAKDLLRLFRAGRDLLPDNGLKEEGKSKKRGRSGKKSSRSIASSKELKDLEEDEFGDDGSFSSGKVTFVSSKAYQQAMNMAIVDVQDALDRMLGKPKSKTSSAVLSTSKWDPSESARWSNLQPIFRSYVFHMVSMCEAVVDPKTVRFLLKRLEKLVPYTRASKHLLKKIIRVAVNVWSASLQHMSQTTRLRAYLLLSKLAHGPGNAEAVLRSCCTVYSTNIANVCNPKTLPLIHFALTCIVELFGIDMGASYTAAFANLREMAVSLRAVLTSKDGKEEVERVHNWSYINRLRLWSRVLCRYGSEDELHPLIYPYVQISLGIMRVHPTPRTYPLRLHVASYLSDLTGEVGTFIPLPPHLLALLRCSELRKKPVHGSAKALEWRSILRVSDDVVKTKPFLTGIINGVVFQLAKYFAAISKHVSFPEVAHVSEMTLRKFSKELQVGEWKSAVSALVEKLHQTSSLVADARAVADFSPHGAVSPEGMLAIVPGLNKEQKMPVERFYNVQCSRVRKEETRRDEEGSKMKTGDTEASSGDESDPERSGDEAGESVTKKARIARRKKQAPELKVPANVGNSDEEDEITALEIDSDGVDEE